jgi:predicted RNA methylase
MSDTMQTHQRHTYDNSFAPAEHLEFVRNKERNAAFRAAFERLARGKTVLDAGTGSGILAILAKKAGAGKVIAIEKDPVMARIARRNFMMNGFNDVQLIIEDVMGIRRGGLPPVDIIVGELLSPWCIVEPQVPVFRHLMDVVGGTPLAIPGKVMNYAQGVNANFADEDRLVEIVTQYFEFASTLPKAEAMTERGKAFEIEFSRGSRGMATQASFSLSLRATRQGTINALRISSVTETCSGVTFGPRDDTMPEMIVPLGMTFDVSENQELTLHAQCGFGAGWNGFRCGVRL